MSVINWQVNALRWLSLLVLAVILILSGCGINSQSATHLNPDSVQVKTPAVAAESTVELAPVNTSTAAIAPSEEVNSEVKNLPTAEVSDVVEQVKTPALTAESTVELAPVNTSTEAIAPSEEVKNLLTAQMSDVADLKPEEASKLATGDSSQITKPENIN
ncbi:MAG: hypothetical protein HC862_22145 [Scytonema sp. RU_4_4]|nr:hypothetical protein [Scytonema sp. RU_4_4]NJR76739.1 hypothetical protein [Scytonema sp. CRU_2_7]